MTFAVFHDFSGLENGPQKFHDFPGPVGTLEENQWPQRLTQAMSSETDG